MVWRTRQSRRLTRLERQVAGLKQGQKLQKQGLRRLGERLKTVESGISAVRAGEGEGGRLAMEGVRALELLMIDVNALRRDVDAMTGADE